MSWTEQYQKAVTFSYDDGVYQDIRLVNLFNQYGLKCTFNLNSGLMNPDSVWYAEGVRVERMPPEGLPELYRGHEIASHLTKHDNPLHLDSHMLYEDIMQDKAALGELFGCEVSGLAYPFGATDKRVQDVVKYCGIRYARGVESTHTFEPPANLLDISPTCRHKEENIFALAGHSYEFDMQDGWERFERFCDLIAGHDDIYYGTCGSVFNSELALRGGEKSWIRN